ncbi:2-dehydropantoate 2-reductase [Parahaliea maris]|uniref:2-dehydropantoate 2-reductase n=1 Tax=Parahaliea maris TaxID=2716870 RepID=A0A5C9A9H0_9GAMM|nr:2-dehydropantoate 2-reductase [Parahaliea maris]TXS96300.1 2-dehydropantoate 2-reductase [Parahaliea maris]
MSLPWYILGCGAMGSLHAAQLDRAGESVIMLPRSTPPGGGPLQLEICGLSTSRHALPWQAPEASAPIDRLLVLTKAYDVAAAIGSVARRLTPQSQVVLMANGMGYAEEIAARLPGLSLAFGTSTQGAHRTVDGKVHHAGLGSTRVGMPGVIDAPAWFSPLGQALPDCEWEADISMALWQKLAVNCAINPLTSLHNCRNGELARDPHLAQKVRDVCGEIAEVAEAAGQVLPDLESRVFSVIDATADNRSSMLQDVSRGQRTEIDYINGYLVRQARQLAVPAPLNEALWHAVRDLTAP